MQSLPRPFTSARILHVAALLGTATLAACSGGGGSMPPALSTLPNAAANTISIDSRKPRTTGQGPTAAPSATASPASTALPVSSAATASPAPTATPASTATPAPTASPASSTYIAPANAQPFPNSPFDNTVSSPQISSNSAQYITSVLAGYKYDLGQMQFSTATSGPTDQDVPVYTSHNSDVHYTIHCMYYSNCPLEGHDVAIPKGALPAGNLGYTSFTDDGHDDQHMAIRNLDTQVETDMWLTPQPNNTGGTLNIGYGGSFPFSSGGIGQGGATAAGFALSQGLVRPVDLVAGYSDGTLPRNPVRERSYRTGDWQRQRHGEPELSADRRARLARLDAVGNLRVGRVTGLQGNPKRDARVWRIYRRPVQLVHARRLPRRRPCVHRVRQAEPVGTDCGDASRRNHVGAGGRSRAISHLDLDGEYRSQRPPARH